MFGYFIPGWGDVEQRSHDFYKQRFSLAVQSASDSYGSYGSCRHVPKIINQSQWGLHVSGHILISYNSSKNSTLNPLRPTICVI